MACQEIPEKQNDSEDLELITKNLMKLRRGAIFVKDPKKRRKCPLCKLNMNLYSISLEEMFFMCEDSKCDFPIGYEALQIVQDESELRENPAKATKDFFEYPTQSGGVLTARSSVTSTLGIPTGTMSSQSCTSDCERLSQFDADDILEKEQKLYRRDLKRKKMLEEDREFQNLKRQSKELMERMSSSKASDSVSKDERVIRNEKFLKNLKTWEIQTGKKFLTDDDNLEFVKTVPKSTELTFSVAPTTVEGTTPAVKINIL